VEKGFGPSDADRAEGKASSFEWCGRRLEWQQEDDGVSLSRGLGPLDPTQVVSREDHKLPLTETQAIQIYVVKGIWGVRDRDNPWSVFTDSAADRSVLIGCEAQVDAPLCVLKQDRRQ
jgi:hypothetical protein